MPYHSVFPLFLNYLLSDCEGINGLTISNALHMSGFLGKEIELKDFDHDLFYEELKKRIATSRRKENVKEAKVDMGDSFR